MYRFGVYIDPERKKKCEGATAEQFSMFFYRYNRDFFY